jgi:hypothetical protein
MHGNQPTQLNAYQQELITHHYLVPHRLSVIMTDKPPRMLQLERKVSLSAFMSQVDDPQPDDGLPPPPIVSGSKWAYFTQTPDEAKAAIAAANYMSPLIENTELPPVDDNYQLSSGQPHRQVSDESFRTYDSVDMLSRQASVPEDHSNINQPPIDLTSVSSDGSQSGKYDFIRKYSSILCQPEETLPQKLDKYDQLTQLCSDFVDMATRYGEVIINELALPDKEKTIQVRIFRFHTKIIYVQ